MHSLLYLWYFHISQGSSQYNHNINWSRFKRSEFHQKSREFQSWLIVNVHFNFNWIEFTFMEIWVEESMKRYSIEKLLYKCVEILHDTKHLLVNQLWKNVAPFYCYSKFLFRFQIIYLRMLLFALFLSIKTNCLWILEIAYLSRHLYSHNSNIVRCF